MNQFMGTMRVGFIAHYTELYGANRSLIDLLDGLRPKGVQSHVILPGEGPLADILRSRHIPYMVIPFKWWIAERLSGTGFDCHARKFLGPLSRMKTNLFCVSAITKQMREWDIDLVHSNSAVTPIGAMAAALLRRPHVWHLREFCDLDYGLNYDFGKKLTLAIINKTDALIAISKAVADYYFDCSLEDKKHIIYNGVLTSEQFENLKNTARICPNRFTFALVGFIHPAKRQDMAIRALARLAGKYTGIRLLIVGDGDTRSVKNLAYELGVEKQVEFWGRIEDPYRAYLEANAVLMCSRSEAMGRVTVEAMAACRPVIGYAAGGTVELIEDGRTGLLFDGGEESLAEAMEKLILNPDWARELGENALCHARSNYTIEKYAESVYQVYELLIKPKKSWTP